MQSGYSIYETTYRDDDCWRTDRRKIKENESEILYETELNNVESRYRRDIDLAGKKLNSELIEYCRDVTKDYEKKVKVRNKLNH
mmetsp:Transcript_3987/g.5408  ORF Transcript_3987/g.5408 Transcript_3987/m.5408 type:complete len:84 (+) Transcript_3987:729-980(+)